MEDYIYIFINNIPLMSQKLYNAFVYKLYDRPEYCKGLIENIRLIKEFLPNWHVIIVYNESNLNPFLNENKRPMSIHYIQNSKI